MDVVKYKALICILKYLNFHTQVWSLYSCCKVLWNEKPNRRRIRQVYPLKLDDRVMMLNGFRGWIVTI